MNSFKLIIIALLLAANTTTTLAHGPYKVYVRIQLEKMSQINELPTFVHPYSINHTTIDAFFDGKWLKKFTKLNLNFQFIPDPELSAKSLTMATTVEEMANWDRYPTYEVYVQLMKNFQTNYPQICQLHEIGTTNEGRQILALKISDNPTTDETEPEMLYTGQMHGDELVAGMLFLRLADYLLKNYNNDNQIKNLIDNIEIWINPLANPDGTYHGGNATVAGAIRGNAKGIDINRNFPDPRAGNNPDGNIWQTETELMMNFAKERNFVLSANSHSGEEVINYPWDTWTRRHVDTQWFSNVSNRYTNLVHTQNADYISGFDNGVTNGSDWYIITGGRQDYMTYFRHAREITFELSKNKAVNADDLPLYWLYNKQALINYINEALYGISGIVTDADNQPIAAKIEISGHDSNDDQSFIFAEKLTGNYHRLIAAGSYNMLVSAYAHQTASIDNIVVADLQVASQNIRLQPHPDAFNLNGATYCKQTNTPVSHAEIFFASTPYEAVFTDNAGQFSINNMMPQNHQISIAAIDFWTQNQTINLSGNNNLNIELDSIANESFENTLISAWKPLTEMPWLQNTQYASNGSKSIKSSTITDSQSSGISLQIGFSDNRTISFDYKVDSEADYDFLRFYLDGLPVQSWSGNTGWKTFSVELPAGMHTLSWQYMKDGNTASGEDAAWLDNFIFDGNTNTAIDLAQQTADIQVFPIPFVDNFIIQNNDNQHIKSIKLFNMQGKLLASGLNFNQNQIHFPLDFDNSGLLANGVYFIKIATRNKVYNYKIIKN